MQTEWSKIKTSGILPAYPSLKSRISGFTYCHKSKFLQLCLTPEGDKLIYWLYDVSEWEFVSVLFPSWCKGLHGTFFFYLQHPDFPPFGVHQRPPGNLETGWETLGDLVRLEISLPWRWILPAAAEPPWRWDMPCHSHPNLISPHSKAQWRAPGPLPAQTHAWPIKELLKLSWLASNRKETKTGEVTKIVHLSF